MKRKYSQKLIRSAVDFIRAANEETENGLEEEQVYAMMDAFDPTLKSQLLMEMLMGLGGPIRVQNVGSGVPQKIEAIKAIRAATGYGLKEAKHIVDIADYGVSEISGNWDSETRNQLAHGLNGTGYELV